MCDDDVIGFDGIAFALIGVDAMGHDGMRFPETVFIVSFPILFAIGVQVADPRNFGGVFRKVGLDAKIVGFSHFPEGAHEFVCARRRESWR